MSTAIETLQAKLNSIRAARATREYDFPDGPLTWFTNRIITSYAGEVGKQLKEQLAVSAINQGELPDHVTPMTYAIAIAASEHLESAIDANKGSQEPSIITMWSTMQAGVRAFYDPIIQPGITHELTDALLEDPTGRTYANETLRHIQNRANGVCPTYLNPTYFYQGMQLGAEVFSILSR